MKIPVPSSFRARVFIVLTCVSLIPTVLTVTAGVLVLREVVESTGSAGAWEQVAQSGRVLFGELEERPLDPELATAAERHEAALGESVRFSRIYALLGERTLALLPFLGVALLILVATLSLVAASWFARDFSRPVEELVAWTRSLAAGAAVPDPASDPRRPTGIREFAQLRGALHTASLEIRESRRKELERARVRSWADMARKIAHELKNPLTPMSMAADRVARSNDPAVASAGEVLREEIQRLDAMARSLSLFGKPPEGPMSEVDLTEMLTGLTERLGSPRSPIATHLHEHPVTITGHLQALERVARNLIANALEASESAGGSVGETPAIEVSLRALDEGVEFRVADRGSGLGPEVLERLWEPEFTTKARGTGLGLPMVRQVVESHGGSVSARNREGGGAEFTVRLPYLPPTTDS